VAAWSFVTGSEEESIYRESNHIVHSDERQSVDLWGKELQFAMMKTMDEQEICTQTRSADDVMRMYLESSYQS
jgi:hypothetical protein